MSDEARIDAAAKIIDESFDDVALGWSQAERMEFAQRIAKVVLAAADAAGETVTVSRDDLRAVLELADYWIDPSDVASQRLDPLDRLRAIVEANT
jgi:hypothetical protein